jgi:hypothetical protein
VEAAEPRNAPYRVPAARRLRAHPSRHGTRSGDCERWGAMESEHIMNKLPDRSSIGYLLLLSCLLGFAYYEWSVTPARIAQRVTKSEIENPGIYGDQFGSFNALFSSFAFMALIVTLLMQMKELRLQRKEIEDNGRELAVQARALSGGVEISAVSARIASIPTLLASSERILEGLNSTRYGRERTQLYSSTGLKRMIARLRAAIENNDRLLHLAQTHNPLTQDVLDGITTILTSDGATGSLSMARERLLDYLPALRSELEREIEHLGMVINLRKELLDSYARLRLLEDEFRSAKEAIAERIEP